MVQRFLPAVVKGDKRIILVDGVFAGAINRVPQGDDIRSNMVRGGAAESTQLSPREAEICERIGPYLEKDGAAVHRHRRDRWQPDRNQCHLAHWRAAIKRVGGLISRWQSGMRLREKRA